MNQSRVGLIGSGAIGSALREELSAGRVRNCSLAGMVSSSRSPAGELDALAAQSDILVEAAGVGAVPSCLDAARRHDLDLIVCSTGAFADPGLESWLATASDSGRVVLPAGAIGGLDLLMAVARSAAPMQVKLTTTKRSEALDADPAAGRITVFRGSAREAIARYPKTANVGVTLALATTGLDATTVEVVADPDATLTRHEVRVDSELGTYHFSIENSLAPGSGARTSALTTWSALSAVERLAARGRHVSTSSSRSSAASGDIA
jgi:aspartate dehydrogenase